MLFWKKSQYLNSRDVVLPQAPGRANVSSAPAKALLGTLWDTGLLMGELRKSVENTDRY